MRGKRSKSCSRMAVAAEEAAAAGWPLLSGANISSDHNSSYYSCKDHDQFLPIANVSRIMKKSLPENAKISKEAKETVQECVSEFISFITGEASDKCQREKRKTVNGDDLLWAMTTLGFEYYVNPLKLYLSKYRENEVEKTSLINPIDEEEEEEEYQDHGGRILISSSSSPSDSMISNKKLKVNFHTRNELLPSPYSGEDPGGEATRNGGVHTVLGHGNKNEAITTNNFPYGIEW